MNGISAVLVGAGKGKRVGYTKSFIPFGPYPLFFYPFKTFLQFSSIIKEIVLVFPSEKIKEALKYLGDFQFPVKIKIISGGKNRFDSVKKGVFSSSYDHILIHDIARPFISFSLLKSIIDKGRKKKFVIPYIPCNDTILQKNRILKRENLKLIQTPQFIEKKLLLKAYKKARRKYSDESTLIQETLKKKPFYIEGEPVNAKLTTLKDLEFFYRLLKGSYEPRIGFGYDFHSLKKGRPLYIGGVKIPFSKGAVGHSDGDALIHSIVDAILGAISLKDIGTYFKESDKRWKDVRSEVFLRKVLAWVIKKNCVIGNIDATIILEEPKIREHRKKIIKNLSRLLGIPEKRISIKGKTQEGYGIIGKGDGIAVCTVCILFQNSIF